VSEIQCVAQVTSSLYVVNSKWLCCYYLC